MTTCVKCEREMERVKSGVVLVKMFNDPPQPYQMFWADLYRCPKCKFAIVTGAAKHPFAEHYQDNFKDKFAAMYYDPQTQIVYEYEQ